MDPFGFDLTMHTSHPIDIAKKTMKKGPEDMTQYDPTAVKEKMK